MRLDWERGEGLCLYTGERRGAPFIGLHLGFTGWTHRDGRVYWFCRPTIILGRLFGDGRGRSWSRPLELPGWLVDGWRRARGRA